MPVDERSQAIATKPSSKPPVDSEIAPRTGAPASRKGSPTVERRPEARPIERRSKQAPRNTGINTIKAPLPKPPINAAPMIGTISLWVA